MVWQAVWANLMWAAPAWGWGLAALAMPIAAHLMARWGGRLAVFPAVRFVQRARADASRLDRPRHWLLWLLRTLALILIVAAFAQPVWLGAAVATSGDTPLVIVVDRSASMNRTLRGVSLFDEAKARAMRVIEVSAGRPVVLVLADAQPGATLPEPTRNTEALVAQLREAEPTWHHADLDRAVAAARDTLARGPERLDPTAADVEVYTDTAGVVTSGRRMAVKRISGPMDNLALSSPRVAPNPPVVGQPATISVVATNHGRAATDAEVNLAFGETRQARSLRLDAGQQATVAFAVTPERAGEQTALFQLGAGDAMSMDNRVGLVTPVESARPVTLVTRVDADDPRTAAYFLKRALVPDRTGAASGIDLMMAKPEDLSRTTMRASGVYVVCEAGPMSGEAVDVLRQHAEAGGGLLWIADDAASIAGLDRLGDASPLRITADTERRPQRLAYGDFAHPVLAIFEGASRSTLLNMAVSTASATAVPRARALLVSEDGTPVLATTPVEAGRVAVLNTELSTDALSWGKSPSFVAMLHQLVRTLAPGQPVPTNLRPDVLGPAASPGPVTSDGVARWVELDPRESDLLPRSDETHPDHPVASDEPADEAARPHRSETPLWPWLVGAAVLMLMAESGVVSWNGRGS